MANLQERSGRVNIRVGGNSQDTAVLVDSTPDGKILEKNVTGASNPVGPGPRSLRVTLHAHLTRI